MSCEHTRAVLEGEAPLADTAAHLTGCADCQALAQALDAIDDLATSLPPPAVPADLLAATRAAMAAEVRLEDALEALTPPPVPADLLAATRAGLPWVGVSSSPNPSIASTANGTSTSSGISASGCV